MGTRVVEGARRVYPDSARQGEGRSAIASESTRRAWDAQDAARSAIACGTVGQESLSPRKSLRGLGSDGCKMPWGRIACLRILSPAFNKGCVVGSANQPDSKPIVEWTVKEWLEYHQKMVHQGSLNQAPDLQQRWMGRIIWKNPLDCWIYQEILYETRPEVVVEVGVAHGGGTLYLANLLDLLGNPSAMVVGIDLDPSHVADLSHPRIKLIQGNCLNPETIGEVTGLCEGRKTMVIADCDHSKDHVMQELRAYSPLVSVGCYYIVEDGICDVMGWAPIPGPQAGCIEFLKENPHFVSEVRLRQKYLITYNFSGYLKKVS